MKGHISNPRDPFYYSHLKTTMANDATSIYVPKSLKRALDARKPRYLPYHAFLAAELGLEEAEDQ